MIVKQNIPIAMGQGLDQKIDPKQIPMGKYSTLQNTIFQKGGLLQKRNGYGSLPSLPDGTSTFLTTFNENLTAIGQDLKAFSNGSETWISKGNIKSIELDTLPLIRSNLNQSQCDAVVSQNGLVCTVYTDTGGSITPQYKYAIADSVTGQNIVAPTVLVATGSPRVFVLSNYFIIVYTNNTNLNYVAVSINNLSVTSPSTISSIYSPASTVAFDGVVSNNSIYLAWNGSDGGGSIRMAYIDHFLVQHGGANGLIVSAGHVGTTFSVCSDETQNSPVIYVSFYNLSSQRGYVMAVNPILVVVFVPVQIIFSGIVPNLASAAQNQLCTIFFEVQNAYSYDSNILTDFINITTITQAGVRGSITTLIRSVGLASKAFIINKIIYILTAYDGKVTGSTTSAYQPSYFIIDSSSHIVAKLAYSNGGGYLITGLPSALVSETSVNIAYLFKDLVEAINKTPGATFSSPVYSQTGINLSTFDFTTDGLNTAEIGSNLNLSGGLVWAYDGYSLVEQGFNLWPDSVEATTATGSGGIAAGQYFYMATYEWSDNQGNVFRSAPSIPISITTTTASSTNTVNVPTLRITSKIANPVKLVLYRSSVAQPTFYQTTSITAPILNDPTVDSIAIVDTHSDAQIVGNNILYTTGGVIENLGPPSAKVLTLYKSRLMLVDSEDQNLIWFSKQVIEATPVEMSDLFTIYVAPTTSSSANTGPITALSALDDKLIIFKKNAIYYLTGNGPDNLGSNNDFSDPIFITSTVGCANQSSIVFMPNGLMFQSDKGIWLLGRDLSTQYIGAPVEDFNEFSVRSAVNIPATNQVRFTMSDGTTLMYDYYFQQWGTFVDVPSVSSCIYNGLHTYINSFGQAFQETPGKYLDGSRPTLINFTTGWINPAGLQGYIRSYLFYLLGQYLSPHKLHVSIAYDYNDSPSQSLTISPDNFSPNYGIDSPYGAGDPYGGPTDLEQWRIFLNRQRCMAFKITIEEIYDPSFGISAGAGLTLSGLNLLIGIKKGWNTISSAHSVGGG